MQVSSEIAAGREDSLVVLTLTLAVELLPPLCDVMELRLEVGDNLDLLSGLSVKSLTHSSIACRDILTERNVACGSLLHVGSTLDELLDVESGYSDRQQAHRGEH